MAADRLLIVPRWSGHADSDFYPWLERSLVSAGFAGQVETVALRRPDEPDIDLTVAAVRGRIGNADRAARTVVLGHSVGAQAVMRAVARTAEGVEVAAIVLIAAWWTVDEPWDSIRPWIDTPLDWAAVRSHARAREVLLSTSDPFTRDASRSRRLFEERIDARVRIVDGAEHFNGTEQPAVLEVVSKHVMPSTGQ